MASTSSSKGTEKPYLSAPYLLFPSTMEKDDTKSIDRSLFTLSEKTFYESKQMFKGLNNAHCVGSSLGWLLVLDENVMPFIFNPFSGARFRLPSFPSAWSPLLQEPYFVEDLRKHFIAKAVLRCDWEPFSHIRRFIVVIIFGSEYKLALCKSGDTTWTHITSAKREYSDMIFVKSQLYALTTDGFLEVWRFRAREPNRVFDVKLSAQIHEEEIRNFPAAKFSARLYLVESEGKLLLVKRIIGDMVNSDGIAVDEADLLESDSHPLVCPYRTKQFFVYKIDSITGMCEKMEFLNGQVLFLGGNESTSLSAWVFRECEANSIYFTDDRWDVVEDYLYGGHDLGIFSVQDRSVKPLIPYNRDKIEPAPIWIFPTPNSSFHQL